MYVWYIKLITLLTQKTHLTIPTSSTLWFAIAIVLLSYITHLEFAWIPSLNPISLFCLPFSTSSSTLRNSMNYIFFLPKRTFSIQFANLSLCYSSNLLFLFPYPFTSKIFFGSFILSSSIFKYSPPIYFSSLALH